jgi:hypothetical protein
MRGHYRRFEAENSKTKIPVLEFGLGSNPDRGAFPHANTEPGFPTLITQVVEAIRAFERAHGLTPALVIPSRSIDEITGPLVQSALERFYQGDPPDEVIRDGINSGFLAALYEMDALGEVFGG